VILPGPPRHAARRTSGGIKTGFEGRHELLVRVSSSMTQSNARSTEAPLALRHSFALFVLAATVGFLLDAGVLTVLVRALAWGPWQGRFVSFPPAVTATWWLNRRFAFRGAGHSDRRVEYAAYWAIQLAGAAVNFAIFGLCLRLAPGLVAYPFVPVAIGGIAAMVFNFLVARATVYRRALAVQRDL
jgi:putative flippase GtrA